MLYKICFTPDMQEILTEPPQNDKGQCFTLHKICRFLRKTLTFSLIKRVESLFRLNSFAENKLFVLFCNLMSTNVLTT